LSNSFQYKNFQLDVLFQFVNQIKPNLRQNNKTAPGFMANQDENILSDGFKPSMTSGSTAAFAYLNYYLNSDAVYSGASFIRLKNLSLSYELPDTWIKAVKIKSASFFARGQNLFTITNYFGFDPETGSVALPPLRQLIAGIHCSL
ncbi:MAG TPA: SusC/RagA family TonB-linked outer membrane protein, partial [Niastella sp.]